MYNYTCVFTVLEVHVHLHVHVVLIQLTCCFYVESRSANSLISSNLSVYSGRGHHSVEEVHTTCTCTHIHGHVQYMYMYSVYVHC